MNTNHFDKNGKKVNIGDWVWFWFTDNDTIFTLTHLPKRGVIVKFNDDDSVKLVNSDGYGYGYFSKKSQIVTEFNVYLTDIEK